MSTSSAPPKLAMHSSGLNAVRVVVIFFIAVILCAGVGQMLTNPPDPFELPFHQCRIHRKPRGAGIRHNPQKLRQKLGRKSGRPSDSQMPVRSLPFEGYDWNIEAFGFPFPPCAGLFAFVTGCELVVVNECPQVFG